MTSPSGYVLKCLRKSFDGRGRARRSEFWWFALLVAAVLIIAVTADVSVFPRNYETGLPIAMPVAAGASFVLLAPSVSVTSRRLHDLGISGWWAALLWVCVPFYLGVLALGVAGFIPGQPEANAYGPNPKIG